MCDKELWCDEDSITIARWAAEPEMIIIIPVIIGATGTISK
jgi:hypothetical protein